MADLFCDVALTIRGHCTRSWFRVQWFVLRVLQDANVSFSFYTVVFFFFFFLLYYIKNIDFHILLLLPAGDTKESITLNAFIIILFHAFLITGGKLWCWLWMFNHVSLGKLIKESGNFFFLCFLFSVFLINEISSHLQLKLPCDSLFFHSVESFLWITTCTCLEDACRKIRNNWSLVLSVLQHLKIKNPDL